jgi:Bacteriocin-protection, YdeI or OmpD-Associated/Domain of unknown function (DUF1905)
MTDAAAPRAAFRTTILASGGTAAGIEVPPEAVESLGAGKRPPVVVTINGYSYRNTVAVMGGAYMIGVSNEHRAASGLKAGDEVDVVLVLDTAPRTVDLPADFATALDAEPAARATFDKLSPSNKGYHVSLIEGAKSEETRQRRIEKSIAALREGRPR